MGIELTISRGPYIYVCLCVSVWLFRCFLCSVRNWKNWETSVFSLMVNGEYVNKSIFFLLGNNLLIEKKKGAECTGRIHKSTTQS